LGEVTDNGTPYNNNWDNAKYISTKRSAAHNLLYPLYPQKDLLFVGIKIMVAK
jgi:hypothetical protein